MHGNLARADFTAGLVLPCHVLNCSSTLHMHLYTTALSQPALGFLGASCCLLLGRLLICKQAAKQTEHGRNMCASYQYCNPWLQTRLRECDCYTKNKTLLYRDTMLRPHQLGTYVSITRMCGMRKAKRSKSAGSFGKRAHQNTLPIAHKPEIRPATRKGLKTNTYLGFV